MKPLDFIATANRLTRVIHGGRPLEADLRRAVSTTYYALFHCLAECCANMLVGSSGARGSRPEWNQAYRALEHSTVGSRCRNRERIGRFSEEIQDFAKLFVDMQNKRNRADYDPSPLGINKSTVVQNTRDAEVLIRKFAGIPTKERRAFAAYIVLHHRRSSASRTPGA